MLSHLNRPLTRRYRTDLHLGGGDLPIGHSTVVVVAMLFSALLVGLATVALH